MYLHKPLDRLATQIVRKNAQGVEVDIQVDHGTDRIVKEKPAKPKAEPTPKKAKVAKQPKPKKVTGVSLVNAQVVLTIFELARKGDDNKAISSATKIPVSYIGPILVAHPDWVKHTQAEFATMGQSYPEKFVRPKPEKPAQHGQVQA